MTTLLLSLLIPSLSTGILPFFAAAPLPLGRREEDANFVSSDGGDDGDGDGDNMAAFGVPCIAVSCSFILLTMFLAEAARKITGAVLRDGLAKVCGVAAPVVVTDVAVAVVVHVAAVIVGVAVVVLDVVAAVVLSTLLLPPTLFTMSLLQCTIATGVPFLHPQIVILEFVAAAEMCGTGFELIISQYCITVPHSTTMWSKYTYYSRTRIITDRKMTQFP